MTTPDPVAPARPALGEERRVDAREALADFEAGKLVWRSIVGVVVFLGSLTGLAFLFKDHVIASSTTFVEVAGGPGILAAWFVLDLVPVPIIPQDIFATLGLIGGCGFWPTMGWASAGSLLGGSASWLVSSRLSHVPIVHRGITAGRGRRMFELTRKYGVLALAVGAVSPLPYSISVWACGATGMRFASFFAVSLLRLPRIAFYLWLVQEGVVNALQ